MNRRLFSIATGLSLLLCVTTAVLWVAGGKHHLAFEFVGRDGLLWEVAARGGRLSMDTGPQSHLDEQSVDYARRQWQKLMRQSLPLNRQMQNMFNRRRQGTISRQEWEQYQKDSAPARNAFSTQMRFIMSKMRPPARRVSVQSVTCRGVIAATAMLPLLWALHWVVFAGRVKAARRERNCCVTCGYDLRASKDRCPECGTLISTEVKPRHMTRGLLPIASVLSFLLCGATVVLWARSYRHIVAFDFHGRDGTLWEAAATGGRFTVENQAASRQRAYLAANADYLEKMQRAQQLRSQWQRRPDRFEKCKDNLVNDLVEAEFQRDRALDRLRPLLPFGRVGFGLPMTHSLSPSVLAGSTAMLPIFWLVLVVRARARETPRQAVRGTPIPAKVETA